MAGLMGMKRITEYLELSETTVLKLHKDYRLPMRKIAGLWHSDTELIESWRKRQIAEEQQVNHGCPGAFDDSSGGDENEN